MKEMSADRSPQTEIKYTTTSIPTVSPSIEQQMEDVVLIIILAKSRRPRSKTIRRMRRKTSAD